MRQYIAPLVMALMLFSSIIAVAAPPDTLDFGHTRFIKTQSLLFNDIAENVSVRTDGKLSFPASVTFRDSVVFYGSDGIYLSSDSLPAAASIKTRSSLFGEYLYIFGPNQTRPGGFHRLYRYSGEQISARQDSIRIGLTGDGIPLEQSKCFMQTKDGNLAITDFTGKVLAQVQLQSKEHYEDGDIILTATQDNGKIYAAVNKFKMPKPDEPPVLISFDRNLNELSRTALPYQMALVMNVSGDGRYLAIRCEVADGASPIIITDSIGNELIRYDRPQNIKITDDSKFLLHIKLSAKCEIISTSNWQVVYAPDTPLSGFHWLDSDIAGNGDPAILYNGDELYMVCASKKTWGKCAFPYAFKTVRLFDDGRRIIMSGEFGALVYEIASE